MPTDTELKRKVETNLHSFNGNLKQSALQLFSTLGYQSDKTIVFDPNTSEGFKKFLTINGVQSFNAAKAHLEEWRTVDFLFQLTDEEVGRGKGLFNSSNVDVTDKRIESYLFLAIKLKSGEYKRSDLAEITREINKAFPMPVMILFQYGESLTFSIIDRRLNKRDESKDVLRKVTLIKDIRLENPHRAHIEILADLALNNYEVSNFLELHSAWQTTLDTKELNKRFFQELANWYFWAVQEVEFPNDEEKNIEVRNATSVIRLITRFMFVWFLKEKGLVSPHLFDENYLRTMLHFSGDSAYYKSILQNLFFATLNSEMGSRKFITESSGGRNHQHFVHNVFRYKKEFKRPEESIKELFEPIPFLNGGLFECLDKEIELNGQSKRIRIDGFSDHKNNALYVPDDLFFIAEDWVDLSQVYDDPRKSNVKVRGLINILNSYKFTITENTPIEEEIALDPELLGRVFENLLASYNPETKTTARKQTGSFYTPREIVNYMVDESLIAYFKQRLPEETEGFGFIALGESQTTMFGNETRLQQKLELPVSGNRWQGKENELESALIDLFGYSEDPHRFNEKETEILIRLIDNCKILDPACGSGAFPMGILHRLVHLLSKLDKDNTKWKRWQKEKALRETEKAYEIGDVKERDERLTEINHIFEDNSNDYGRKLFLIENCIYGVDIQPIAIQIAKLRFFISLIVDQKANREKLNLGVRPLPNLETKFVAADTLIGLDEEQGSFARQLIKDKENELREVRAKHFGARTRKTKESYREKDKKIRLEIAQILKEMGFNAASTEKISLWNPYDQNASADWFDSEWTFGIKEGFDIVIGNPPYVQLQKMGPTSAQLQKANFETFEKTGDIYSLFYETGFNVLRSKGILAFITSNKWMRAGYGESTRKFFADKTNPVLLIDFAGQKIFESATVDTNILLFTKEKNKGKTLAFVAKEKVLNNLSVFVRQFASICRFNDSGSWVILSPTEQRIKAKIEAVGIPLKEWDISIYRGVLTGFNQAFIIDGAKKDELILLDPKSADIIRPILRGRDVRRYAYDFADLWLINTHNGIKDQGINPIDINDYPAIKNHLDQFYPDLKKRADKGDTPYNLRNCAYMDDFSKQKIVWGNLNLKASYTLAPAGMYVSAPCPLIVPANKYLLAILNSKLADYYIRNLGVTRNGGYFEYKPMFIEKLPVPILSENDQLSFTELVEELEKNTLDNKIVESKINALVYQIYEMSDDEIEFIQTKS